MELKIWNGSNSTGQLLDSTEVCQLLPTFASFAHLVQYSPNMLGSLLRAIKSNELSVEDRYGLSNDLLALTESGRIPASQFLGFFAELTNEDEYTVWQVINGGVSKIGMLLDRNQPDLKPKFDKFVCQVLEPVSKRLGWTFEKGEDAHRSVLRGLIFGALARAGHRQTIDQMLKLFDEYVGDNTSAVHPEFRKVVFNTAAKHNDNSGAYLMKLYETCNNSEIERDCLIALGITKNEEERKHIFSTGIIGKTFRAQDLYVRFHAPFKFSISFSFCFYRPTTVQNTKISLGIGSETTIQR